MEDKTMMEILHDNCKKEQTRKAIARQQYKEEQEYGKKWCKRLLITGITCIALEVLIIIVERMI